MRNKIIKFLCSFFILINASAQTPSKPNIIFILSDDVGYSVPVINGGNSFYTPNIDSMARNGINFLHCESTPLCCPSRVMLLTGKYNFRNYSNWGYMSSNEKTFGNVMQDAGYKTGFFGKLQLQFQHSWMNNWGFDKYTVFELTEDSLPTRRYKSPILVDNFGRVPDDLVKDKYCDDILTDRISSFIDSNLNNPFMVYYSMSIGHSPFSPTPDDPEYASWDPYTNTGEERFYPSMINYMDKKIGVLINKLKATGLDKNTIVIFAGDNGVPTQIYYDANGIKNIQGEKGHSTEGGTHVPLIAYWPGHIPKGKTNDDLIDFSDFLPTFAEIAQTKNLNKYGITDGISFYKKMLGITDTVKQQLFLHYDPNPGFEVLKRWVRNKTYKLYSISKNDSGRFYNISKDAAETTVLKIDSLTPEELSIKQTFRKILDTTGTWQQPPTIKNSFVFNVTSRSAEIGATIESDGASGLLDRGSCLALPLETQPYLFNDRMHDSIIAPGKFEETRDHLMPETRYRFSMYAMNNNASQNTAFSVGSFYTLSIPPYTQPSLLKVTDNKCSVSLNWKSGRFPLKGATKAGYAVYYSSDTIQLIDSPNAKSPSAIVIKGKLLQTNSSILPQLPDSSVNASHLSKDTLYHFLIIPYTWNGISDSTYNYLTKNALTVSVQPSASFLSLNYTRINPLCYGDSSGKISLNASQGTSPYTYSLNSINYGNDSIFTGLKSGSFSISAKDNNGCIATQNVILRQPLKFNSSVTNNNLVCFNDSSGGINITSAGGTPPYIYSINGNTYEQDSVFTNLRKNTYTIISKDANGCEDTSSVVLKQPSQINITTTVQNQSCIDAEDASITVSAQKGVEPYMYSINGSDFKTEPVFENLSSGDYTVTVKDKNGCTASKDINIIKAVNDCTSGIKLSPNPSTDQFNINIGTDLYSKEISVKVSDANGKNVLAKKSSINQNMYLERISPKEYIL